MFLVWQTKDLDNSVCKYCLFMTSLLVCILFLFLSCYSYTNQLSLSHISICGFLYHNWPGTLAVFAHNRRLYVITSFSEIWLKRAWR